MVLAWGLKEKGARERLIRRVRVVCRGGRARRALQEEWSGDVFGDGHRVVKEKRIVE